ncbi:winged helix-turn-helix domain-containing protein [Chitinophaga tropicalis]|uniref:LysR family transcriptional regulator n=1 Tax=Chitinophaga tropicalis TaxID=2683588 RepID=A0A7K1UCM9_9BACT|nr:LysR family transcriptional regulator [Chitinophaga tropicalis]MVT12144.1 LysR family transcriptional regulator [Chitinophaga tropicalis]
MEKHIKDILSKGILKVNGSLWLESSGKRFFGPGPVELLELISETGSINQAAKRMKMSYKKAWELINNLNSMSASPLVLTSTGGDNGGGSTISDEARQLIVYHKELRTRFSRFLEEETKRLQ